MAKKWELHLKRVFLAVGTRMPPDARRPRQRFDDIGGDPQRTEGSVKLRVIRHRHPLETNVMRRPYKYDDVIVPLRNCLVSMRRYGSRVRETGMRCDETNRLT